MWPTDLPQAGVLTGVTGTARASCFPKTAAVRLMDWLLAAGAPAVRPGTAPPSDQNAGVFRVDEVDP